MFLVNEDLVREHMRARLSEGERERKLGFARQVRRAERLQKRAERAKHQLALAIARGRRDGPPPPNGGVPGAIPGAQIS